MAVPTSATKFKTPMDPAEILDFQIQLRSDADPLLEDGESIATYTLTLYPEAVALGLNVKSGGGYDPVEDGETITVWFDFDVGSQTDVAFDGNGSTLAMELTVITDNVPARKRQRTLTLGALQL